MFPLLQLCRHSKENKTKIRSSQYNLQYARRSFSSRKSRARLSAQAQDDPIKLRRVQVGDDPLIGDIHVSSAESIERRLKRHKSIYAGDTKVERDIARSFAR